MGAGMFGWKIKRCQQHIFKVKPQTLDWAEDFAWLSQSRRLSKDYEITALFSRSIREDRLHSAHAQAFGIILRIVSKNIWKICLF